MRLYITGGTGLVGSNIIKVAMESYGAEVMATIHESKPVGRVDYELVEADVRDRDLIMETIRRFKPELVVHCVAWVSMRTINAQRQEAWDLMVGDSRNVADACKAVGAKLIFVSSDWVFNGTDQRRQQEDAAPNPANYYGLLKVVGETMVRSMGIDYAIARFAGVYGRNWAIPSADPTADNLQDPGFGNLAYQFVEKLRAGREIPVWMEHVNAVANPTLATDGADSVMRIYSRNLQGTFHTCGSESINRIDFARKIAEVFELDASLITTGPMDSELFKALEGFPIAKHICLETSETDQKLGRPQFNVEEGLREFRKQLQQ